MKARRWHLLLLVVVACAFAGSSPAVASVDSASGGHSRGDREIHARLTSQPATVVADAAQHRATKRSATDLLDLVAASALAIGLCAYLAARTRLGRPRRSFAHQASGRAPPRLLIAG